MNSGNPILDKNLECIQEYNPTLVQKLLAIKELSQDIQLVETELKEPNMQYNGVPLHSQLNAEGEAKQIFSQYQNLKINIAVIYGMGLGYLFQEFCLNSKGFVILYEPNLEILRVTLEVVDFSKELSLTKVKVASDLQELMQALALFNNYGFNLDVLNLSSYKQLFNDDIQNLLNELVLIKTSFTIDDNMCKYNGADFMKSIVINLPYSLNTPLLHKIAGAYEDKTAVIVSAGPTLDANIEALKKNRDKVVIFCVGPALRALQKHGIKPDFLNIVEKNDFSGHVKGLDLSDLNLILEPCTNTSIHKLDVKQKFLFPAPNLIGMKFWIDMVGEEIPLYVSKGTVSYEALFSAKMLGCKKLILVGQDLAHLNNQCYSKDAAASDLVYEINPKTGKAEYKIKDYESYASTRLSENQESKDIDIKSLGDFTVQVSNKRACFVKSITGEMIPSGTDYASFISVFTEFARLNKDLNLINTSMIGAQIDGFENMTLEEALKDEVIIEKKSFSVKSNYDKPKILERLKDAKNNFENVLEFFGDANQLIYKTERELKRFKDYNETFYKYFNAISAIYNKCSDDYYKTNVVYQLLAYHENEELQKFVNTTEMEPRERAKIIFAYYQHYFKNVEKRIILHLEQLDEQIKLLSEELAKNK